MDSAQCRARTGRLRGKSERASVLLGKLVVCLLLASALACASGSRLGVASFEDFNRKGDGWESVENRALRATGEAFTDAFAGPEAHVYRMPMRK